jgi:hypothetical protein
MSRTIITERDFLEDNYWIATRRKFFKGYKLTGAFDSYNFKTIQELRWFEENVLTSGSIVEYRIQEPSPSLSDRILKFLEAFD